MKKNYSKKYFEWQKQISRFGGKMNRFKFESYIKSTDRVIDYGCGGGYLMKNINCLEKVGIEINPYARKVAEDNGISVFENINEVKNNRADVVISNHTLEHVENPLQELKNIYKKLKDGGISVFVVPSESYKLKYKSNDPNHHLYTWSPSALGNLFKEAGFIVDSSSPLFHKWPSNYEYIYKLFGEKVFHIASKVNGYLNREVVQIKIIARKTKAR